VETRITPPRFGEDARLILHENLGYSEQTTSELTQSSLVAMPYQNEQSEFDELDDSREGECAEKASS
jgi:hypothetical protein